MRFREYHGIEGVTTVDTIRAVFTYLIALVVVIGGGLILYLSKTDPSAGDFRAVVAGFIAAAITFVFQQETQTRTARQSVASSTNGAMLHANGLSGTPAPPIVSDPPSNG